MKTEPSVRYRPVQRLTALIYGIICHGAFAAAVAIMACSLFTGLQFGRGPFRGWGAVCANALLLASFPLTHSWLLSPRGRRFMARLVPFGIGPRLSWTVFAALSSLQLILVFAGWSFSGITWWQAFGPARILIGLAAAGAWLLLGKSMADAQLGVQTGYVGWSSVFLNRKAVYKPFSTRGLYRHVRQPIYISFALLLWLSAAWTPDQLILAVAWSGYCIVGAALKERRFIRCFGEAFRRYQADVPFWLPRLQHTDNPPETSAASDHDADAIVIGAGPVGLLLANLLGARGLRVLVAERRTEPFVGSMAIGITPPSLRILQTLGLDHEFLERGISITTARVFEQNAWMGDVDFSRLPVEHRCILSLPQSETMEILKRNLTRYPKVHLLEGMEFIELNNEADAATVGLRDVKSGAQTHYKASYLVGCDGHRSRVRRHEGIRFPGRFYRPAFLMADFDDRTDLGREAHLYFGPHGSVESFPLNRGQRRWIIQCAPRELEKEHEKGKTVARRVGQRTLHDLSTSPIRFESSFRPQRRLARRYVKNRVLLCGDAAHVMSPIGGQGMNTGFADAAHLAEALSTACEAPEKAAPLFSDYSRARRQAYRAAAARAGGGMWLGTRTGRIGSTLRRALLSMLLLKPAVRERLAPYFAMLTIPGNQKTLGASLS